MKTMTLEFEVAAESFSLGQALDLPPDATAVAETTVPGEENRFVPFLCLEADDDLTADDIVGDSADVDDVTKLATEGPVQIFRVVWNETSRPLFEAIRAGNGAIQSMEGDADAWKLAVRFPSESAVSEFHTTCRESDVDFRVFQLSQSVMRGSGSTLTNPQRRSLQDALNEGYFEVPRHATLDQLAEKEDISDNALSQRLRRGIDAVLDRELESSSGCETK